MILIDKIERTGKHIDTSALSPRMFGSVAMRSIPWATRSTSFLGVPSGGNNYVVQLNNLRVIRAATVDKP